MVVNKKTILYFVIFLIGIIGVNAALTDGIVAYYTFDGNYPLISNVSQVNNCTATGTVNQTTTPWGKGLDFRGVVNNYVTCTDNNNVFDPGAGNYTWNFLVLKRPGVNNAGVLSRDGANVPAYGWAVFDAANSVFNYASTNAGTPWSLGGPPNTYVQNNTWMMYTLTKAGFTYRLYIDGELRNTTTASDGTLRDDSNPIQIGVFQHDNPGTGYLNGTVDEMGFWNRTLNASEIQQINLSRQYPFNPQTTLNLTINLPTTNQTILGRNLQYNYTCKSTINSTLNTTIYVNNTQVYTNTSYGNNTIILQNFTRPYEINNTIIYCADSQGITSQTITYTLISHNYSLVYNQTSIELNNEILMLNITTDDHVQSINATLNYNATNYQTTRTISGNNTLFNITITTPSIPVNSSAVPFFWNYTIYFNDGSNTTTNTTTRNQTVVWKTYTAELRIKVRNFLSDQLETNFSSNATHLGVSVYNQTNSNISLLSFSIDAHTNKTYNLSITSARFNSINSTYIITYLTNATIEFSPSIPVSLFLIDERTNTAFNLNCSSAKVYLDDNSTLYDFKTNNQTNITLNITTNKMRFEIGYSSGTIITRYIDYKLINDNVRVCANPEGTLHYEQLIISSTVQPIKIKSIYSNCWIANDYTRFTYETSYMLKAYTINSLYNLYTLDDGVETVLGSIDGTIQATINVDTLKFRNKGYDFGLTPDSLASQNLGSSQILFVYANPSNSNTNVSVNIYALPDNTLALSTSELNNPNNFTILFDYSTLSNITNNTIFRVEFTRLSDGKTSTSNYYFSPNADDSGLLRNGVAFAISFLLMIFGLTFAVSRLTLGWFGLIICGMAIAVLSFAVGGVWYINFLMVIEIIIMVFILLTLLNKNSATIN